MARLRFPGRPGRRYGRSLIRFMPHEARKSQNLFFNLTANIQRNLKWFYDTFGDSDEEEEFEGFTLSNDERREYELLQQEEIVEKQSRQQTKRAFLQSQPVHTSGRNVRNVRNVIRRSYAAMLRGEEDVSPKLYKLKKPEELVRYEVKQEEPLQTGASLEASVSPSKLTTIKIKLLPDGKKAKIVRNRRPPPALNLDFVRENLGTKNKELSKQEKRLKMMQEKFMRDLKSRERKRQKKERERQRKQEKARREKLKREKMKERIRQKKMKEKMKKEKLQAKKKANALAKKIKIKTQSEKKMHSVQQRKINTAVVKAEDVETQPQKAIRKKTEIVAARHILARARGKQRKPAADLSLMMAGKRMLKQSHKLNDMVTNVNFLHRSPTSTLPSPTAFQSRHKTQIRKTKRLQNAIVQRKRDLPATALQSRLKPKPTPGASQISDQETPGRDLRIVSPPSATKIAGSFVLPSFSARSARAIKPCKRYLESSEELPPQKFPCILSSPKSKWASTVNQEFSEEESDSSSSFADVSSDNDLDYTPSAGLQKQMDNAKFFHKKLALSSTGVQRTSSALKQTKKKLLSRYRQPDQHNFDSRLVKEPKSNLSPVSNIVQTIQCGKVKSPSSKKILSEKARNRHISSKENSTKTKLAKKVQPKSIQRTSDKEGETKPHVTSPILKEVKGSHRAHLQKLAKDRKTIPLASEVKTPLHPRQFSGGDRSSHLDTVSKQLAEAVEADRSPEQQSSKPTKVARPDNETSDATPVLRGPRIKHVCRRAPLGMDLATFPDPGSRMDHTLGLSPQAGRFTEMDLSIKNEVSYDVENLESPSKYNRKNRGANYRKFRQELMDSGENSEKTAVKSKIEVNQEMPQETPPPLRQNQKLLPAQRVKVKSFKRRQRCGKCGPCQRKDDCGVCEFCLDKTKFGGPNTKKQACIHRKCKNPQHRVDVVKEIRIAAKVSDNVPSLVEVSIPPSESPVPQPSSGYRPHKVSPFKQRLHLGKPKARIKLPTRRGALKVVTNNRPMSRAERLQMEKEKAKLKKLEVNKTSSSSLTVAKQKAKPQIKPLTITHHRINIDFKEDYDIDVAWQRGIAILSSEPMVPRTVCYLCSSTGKHELIYCNVCCEPFHSFCLEDNERPLHGDEENWCCRHCKYCHVCGRQDKLLTCDKCQSSYHPECLGPNYPTKPSKRRKIWVCTKCVKCKSCGATTPGPVPNAQWTHDFSLCQDCGKLFDRGNYCPICSQCYEDNDYESKMMQCGRCDRWVHAKCEGLTDDMYHIMTDLPDSVPYNCMTCDPVRPARWQVELTEEMEAGFTNVIRAMYHCRSAAHLINADKKVKNSRSSNRSSSPANSTGVSRDVTPSPALSDSPSVDSTYGPGDLRTDMVSRRMSPRFLKDSKSRTASPVLRMKDKMETTSKTSDSGETSTESRGHVPSNDSISVAAEQVDTSDASTSVLMETDQGSSHKMDSNDPDTAAKIADLRSNITADGISTQVSTPDNFRLTEELGPNKRPVDLLRETSSNSQPERANSEKMAIGQETPDQGILESLVKSSSNEFLGESEASSEKSNTSISPRIVQDSRTCMGLSDGIGKDLSERNQLESSGNLNSFLDDSSEKRPVDPTSATINRAAVEQDKDILTEQSGAVDSKATMQSLQSNCPRPKESDHQLETMQTDPSESTEDIHALGDSLSTTGPLNMDEQLLVKLSNESSQKNVTDQSDQTSDPSLPMESLYQTGSQTACDANIGTKIPNTPDKNSGSTLPNKDDVDPLDDSISSEVSLFRGLTEKPSSEKDRPKDLKAVNKRVKNGCYKTVAEFCDDCVRIIQQSLSSETDQSPNLKRNNRTACSVFLKHMTRMFPWYKVETSRSWEGNQKYPVGMLSQAVLPPHSDHEYAQWKHTDHPFPSMLQPSPLKRLPFSPTSRVPARIIGGNAQAIPMTEPNTDDTRRCCLCGRFSDDEPNSAGRLLYCGQDEWIHINCGLWSAEVYEEMDGSLINVHAAIWRGRQLRCDGCSKFGATVGCCQRGCPANFHFMCAREKDCVFQEDKKVFCNLHREKVDRDTIQDGNFAVLRRVCVSLDNMKLNRNFAQGLQVDHINVMVGSLTVDDLGRLGPASDQQNALYPLEFKCQRVYWSTFDARRRCVYTIRILEYKDATTPKSPLDVNHTTAHSPGILGSRGFGRSHAHITELSDDMPSIPEIDEECLLLGKKPDVETMDGVLELSLDSAGFESLLDPEMLMQCEADLREGGVDPEAVLSAAALEGDTDTPMEIADPKLHLQDQPSLAVSATPPPESVIEASCASFSTLGPEILPPPFSGSNEDARLGQSWHQLAEPISINTTALLEKTLKNLPKHVAVNSNLITEDSDHLADLNQTVVSLNSTAEQKKAGMAQFPDTSSKGAVTEKGDVSTSVLKTSPEIPCVVPVSSRDEFRETKSEMLEPNCLSVTDPSLLCRIKSSPLPESEDTPTRSVFKFIDKLIGNSATGKTSCDSSIPPRTENGSNESEATCRGTSCSRTSEGSEKNSSQNGLFESIKSLSTDILKQASSHCLKTALSYSEGTKNLDPLLQRTLDNPDQRAKIEEDALLEGFSMPECSDSDLPDGFLSSQESLKFAESADTGDDTDLSQRTRDIVTDVIELENLSKLSLLKPPEQQPPFFSALPEINVAPENFCNVDGSINVLSGSSNQQMSFEPMVELPPSISKDTSATKHAFHLSSCPGTDDKLDAKSVLPTEEGHLENTNDHLSKDRGENAFYEVKVQPENSISHSEQSFLTQNSKVGTADPVEQNSDVHPDATKAITTEVSDSLNSKPPDRFISDVSLHSLKKPSLEESDEPSASSGGSVCGSNLHADTNTILGQGSTSPGTKLVEDTPSGTEERPKGSNNPMLDHELIDVEDDAFMTKTKIQEERSSKEMIQMGNFLSEKELMETAAAHPESKSENLPVNTVLDPESKDVHDSFLSISKALEKKSSEEVIQKKRVSLEKGLVEGDAAQFERVSEYAPTDHENMDVDDTVSEAQHEGSFKEVIQKETVPSRKELVDGDSAHPESKPENGSDDSLLNPEGMDVDDSISEARENKSSEEITHKVMEIATSNPQNVFIAVGGDSNVKVEMLPNVVQVDHVLGETSNQETSDQMACRTVSSSLEPVGDMTDVEDGMNQGALHKRRLSNIVSPPSEDPTTSNETAEMSEDKHLEPAAKRIKFDETVSEVPLESTTLSVQLDETGGITMQNSENARECLELSSSSKQKDLHYSEEPPKETVTCLSAASTPVVDDNSINSPDCNFDVDSCLKNEDQNQTIDTRRVSIDSQSAILVEESSQSQKVAQITDEFGKEEQKRSTGTKESFANTSGPSQNDQQLAVESTACLIGNVEDSEDDVFPKHNQHRNEMDDQSLPSSQCDKAEEDQKGIQRSLRKAVVVLHDICNSRSRRTHSLSSIKSLSTGSEGGDSAPATPHQSRRSSSNSIWSNTKRSKSAPNTPYLACGVANESTGGATARNKGGSSELKVTSKKVLHVKSNFKEKPASCLDSDDSSDDEPLAKLSDKLKTDKGMDSPPEFILDENTGEFVLASSKHSDGEASVDNSSLERKKYPMRSTFSRLTRIVDTPTERAQRRKRSSSSSSLQEGSSTKKNGLSEPNPKEINHETTPPLPKRRGRPPKLNRCINFGKESSSLKRTCSEKPTTIPSEIPKRGRGRPRKVPLNTTSSSQNHDDKQTSQSIASGNNKTSHVQSHSLVPKQNTEQIKPKNIERLSLMDGDSKQKEIESSNDSKSLVGLGIPEETKTKDKVSEDCQTTSSESTKAARRWPLKRVMGDFVSNEALLDLWTALQPDMGPLKQKPKPVEIDKTSKLSESLGQCVIPKDVSKASETSPPKVSTVASSAASTCSPASSPQESTVTPWRHSDTNPGDASNSDYLKTVFRSHTSSQMQRAKQTSDCLITCRKVVTMSVEDLLKMKSKSCRGGHGRSLANTGRKITSPVSLRHGSLDTSTEMGVQTTSGRVTVASESTNQHKMTYSVIKTPTTSATVVKQEICPAKNSGLGARTAVPTLERSLSSCGKLAGTPSTVTHSYKTESTLPVSQPLHQSVPVTSEVIVNVIPNSGTLYAPSRFSSAVPRVIPQGSLCTSQSPVIRTVQSPVQLQSIVSVIKSTKKQFYCNPQMNPPGTVSTGNLGCRLTTEPHKSSTQDGSNKIVIGLPSNPACKTPQIITPPETSSSFNLPVVQNTSPSIHSVIPRPTRSPIAQAMSTHASSLFIPQRSLFTSLITPIENGTLQTSTPVSIYRTDSLPISTLAAPQSLSLSSPKEAVDQLWSIIHQQAQQAQNITPVQQPTNTRPSLHSYAAPYPLQDTTRSPSKRPAEDNPAKRVGAKRRKSPHRYRRIWFDEFGQLHSDCSPPVSPQKQPVAGPKLSKPTATRPRPRIKNASGPRMKMPSHSSDSQEDDHSRPTPRSDSAKTELMKPQTDQDQSSVRLTRGPSRFMAKSEPQQDKRKEVSTEANKENSDAPSPSPPRSLQTNEGYKLLFEVKSDDGFETRAESMVEAWHQVVEKVQERRNDMRMKSLSFAGVDPMKMLGIKHDALVFLIEQLFGAKNCKRYRFKFHQRHAEAAAEEEPPLNAHGCARAEPFKSRSHHDIFDFLASRHRHKPELEEDTQEQDVQHKSSKRATSLDLPMAMRFRHLKDTAKEAVGVYRSLIHGRGLFCKRQIEAGEMVIEYSGNVIRSMLTDKREKYYESKGIGCYMFRIDDFDVVDATVHGNAARFINHSCDPNCFSRVIQVDGKKHIVIFASRKILKGEELTYDYKFPIEDVKIPCNCGALRCRKYLN